MENLPENGGVAAVTIGLVQLIKPYVPSKYLPLTSVAIAVIGSVAVAYSQHTDLVAALMTGLVIGLSSSGLYDVSKVVKN